MPQFRTRMPGAGAVCPATVRYGLDTTSFEASAIVPDVSNTTTRGPVSERHARSDPVPESLRLMTRHTAPPRPAGVAVPKPYSPGTTGSGPLGGGVGVVSGG